MPGDVHYPSLPPMTPEGLFIQLSDVDPASYTGQAGKVLAVNQAEDGLEFTTGGGGSSNASLILNSSGDSTDPVTHPFTYNNCGVILKSANNTEIFRLWGSDPDVSDNYNSGNLYFGCQAGLNQPTDNSSAGFLNVGIGYKVLMAITEGFSNIAIGANAAALLTTGSKNIAIGTGALGGDFTPLGTTTGSGNVAIGFEAMPEASSGAEQLNVCIGHQAGDGVNGSAQCVLIGASASGTLLGKVNAIGIGYNVIVNESNRAVIGNTSITDVHFGGESNNASVFAKNFVTAPVIIANLPSPATMGQIACVTDGDSGLAWGANVVNSGSGATKYLVWFNGATWTVMGK